MRSGSKGRGRRYRDGIVAMAGLALVALTATGSAEAQTRSCGWTLVGSASQVNLLFPDQAATYWQGHAPVPPGGHVEVRGFYPHARYTSLTTYTRQSQSVDGLNDTQIGPDPGSTNPFLPHADRTTTKRAYTVKVADGRLPAAGRAPNTIYTTNADGSKSGTKFTLRIYQGDRGTGIAGGVPLPRLTSVTATGERFELPQCPDVNLPDNGAGTTLANAGAAVPWPAPVGATDAGLLGTDPPVWHRFTNTPSSVITLNTGNAALAAVADDTFTSGGLGDNPDNKYVYTAFEQEFGQVLAFTAKAPSTPATYDGQPRMGTGQLRYWSFCTNAQTTMVYACKQDDQVPTTSRGEYTIVVSTAAARPRNATDACGVAWLPVGAVPQSILILRNMLPDPSFAQAIQRAEPGKEAATMGAHYPVGRYYATTADFERTGCPGAPRG